MRRRNILKGVVALAITPVVAIAAPSFDIAKAVKLYCDIVEKDMIVRIRSVVDHKADSNISRLGERRELTMRKEYYMQPYAIPLHKPV